MAGKAESMVRGDSSARSLWGPLAVALVLLVSSVVLVTGGATGTTAPVPGSGQAILVPTSPLSAASASLARGEGPAAGSALACQATSASGADCSSVPASPASPTATESAGWANLTAQQTVSPPARSYGRSIAFDPVDQYVLMFGGYTGGYLADTWAFQNGTWHQLHPSPAPSPRDHSSLAWDAADGYLVLFGGSGYSGAYSDTWSFLNGTWTSYSPATHPSDRWSTSMVYDAADGYVLLFGGCAGSEISDTWTYSAGTWTQLFPGTHPSDRGDAMMSYNPTDRDVLLFGGEDGVNFGDTWTYHAGNWTQVSPTVSPAARSMASMSYDSELGAIVLFGGSGGTGSLSDTWIFSGGSWTPATGISSPAAQTFGLMTDDPADGYVVLYGAGSSYGAPVETWAFYTIAASAAISAAQAPAPANVTLSAASADPMASVGYVWSFGDGTTGTGASVDHTYLLPGFYYATVSATDANGVSASASVAFQGLSALSAVARVSPGAGVVPLVVDLAAAAVGGLPPYTFAWDLGGGVTSTLTTLNLTLTIPGTYQYGVQVRDSSGQEFAQTFQVVAAAPPIPALLGVILAAPSAGEAPLPVTFTALASGGTPPYAYAWSFGDYSTSVEASPTHDYPASGTFTVTCNVSDMSMQSVHRTVVVTVTDSVWAMGQADATTGTATLNVLFAGQAGGGVAPYGFSWQFGDGGSSANENSTHAYSAPGDYSAVLTVADALGHRADWSTKIHVDAAPVQPEKPVTNSTPAASISPQLVTLGAELVIGAVVVTAIVVFVPRRRR